MQSGVVARRPRSGVGTLVTAGFVAVVALASFNVGVFVGKWRTATNCEAGEANTNSNRDGRRQWLKPPDRSGAFDTMPSLADGPRSPSDTTAQEARSLDASQRLRECEARVAEIVTRGDKCAADAVLGNVGPGQPASSPGGGGGGGGGGRMLPCSECENGGLCDALTGRCACPPQVSGRWCDVRWPASLMRSDEDRKRIAEQTLDDDGLVVLSHPDALRTMVRFVIARRCGRGSAAIMKCRSPAGGGPREATSGDRCDDREDDARVARIQRQIRSLWPSVAIAVVEPSAAAINRALLRDGDEGNHSTRDEAPFVLFLDPTVERVTELLNLRQLVTQMLLTDVDVLGLLLLSPQPLRLSHVAPKGEVVPIVDNMEGRALLAAPTRKPKKPSSMVDRTDVGGPDRHRTDDPVLLWNTHNLDAICFDFVHTGWTLRHRRAPFGYQRHQRFVAYCDRTSHSVLLRRAALRHILRTARDDGELPDGSVAVKGRRAATGGRESYGVHLRLPVAFQRRKGGVPYDSAMAGIASTDWMLRIKTYNSALRRVAMNATALIEFFTSKKEDIAEAQWCPLVALLAQVAERSPTRLPGTVLVGTCMECLIGVQASPKTAVDATCNEVFTPAFSEAHQVEVYVDELGATFGPQCVKSGGIYGHAARGLYSPWCHRLQRQRDFLFLSDLWTDANALLPSGGGGIIDNGGSSQRRPVYAVSLHHGNLFGALRFNEELLWETDGDIDLLAFNATHEQLVGRMERLCDAARQAGFEIKLNYPEKPWYVQFLKDKTDFQMNARSPLDPQTRGRPPQQHNITIWYQGRRVFMNGFQNPWRSIRLDPGHDYRDGYLAQQGWVLHFTKQSVACKAAGHNACLPDCNDPFAVADHARCSEPEPLPPQLRNPVLLFDGAAPRAGRGGGSSDDPLLRRAALGEAATWGRHTFF